MHLSALALAAAALVGSAAHAQTAPETIPAVVGTAAHALPFASAGHTLELTLAGDAAKTSAALSVTIASAPAWLTFDRTEAAPEAAGEGEPVARLGFAVARDAPVGVPAEVAVVVCDAAGRTVGERTVRVVVDAPVALAVEVPRPNPARGAVSIPFVTPGAGPVRVSVLDLLGREVAVLVDEPEAPAGAHVARLAAGRLASGVYGVRVAAGGAARAVRLTVVR